MQAGVAFIIYLRPRIQTPASTRRRVSASSRQGSRARSLLRRPAISGLFGHGLRPLRECVLRILNDGDPRLRFPPPVISCILGNVTRSLARITSACTAERHSRGAAVRSRERTEGGESARHNSAVYDRDEPLVKQSIRRAG